MSTPKPETKFEKVPMTVRIAPETHDRIVKEADARMVSPSWLVDRLLADAVTRLAPIEDLFSGNGTVAAAETAG